MEPRFRKSNYQKGLTDIISNFQIVDGGEVKETLSWPVMITSETGLCSGSNAFHTIIKHDAPTGHRGP